MKWTGSSGAVFSIGILHVAFMLGELFPWKRPCIMALVLRTWPDPLKLSKEQEHFVSNVVHNAGIYNGIVAAGLFVSAFLGARALPVQVTLLMGGIVAGVFGAMSLTRETLAQAILGAIALGVVLWFRP